MDKSELAYKILSFLKRGHYATSEIQCYFRQEDSDEVAAALLDMESNRRVVYMTVVGLWKLPDGEMA